jgi:hypothetical protein
MTEVEPSTWVVRAGAGSAYAEVFLERGLVGIGFGGTARVDGLDWRTVQSMMRKQFPDQSLRAQGLAAGALYRFATDMRAGGLVLTPERGGTFLAGQITGQYEFVDTPPVADYRHIREVRWFARLERSAFSQDLLKSLQGRSTLYTPSRQTELRSVLSPLLSGEPPVVSVVAAPPTHVPPPTASTVAIPDSPVDPPVAPGTQFGTDKQALRFILDQIANRFLALPDFQRSFVWDPNATRELLASIIRGFPAGTLLFLERGSEIFRPREVEGAPALNGREPKSLILDGQQRLTSLFQALRGVGAHRFYVDLAELMGGEDIDGAVKYFTATRAKSWSTREAQARALLLPFWEMMDSYLEWRDVALATRQSDGINLRDYLTRVEGSIVRPVRDYQFPLTTLTADTPIEAVCTIFETLNRTGIKLSVFELITARAFAAGERLRQRWQEALDAHPILDDFSIDPYYILQTIALRLGKEPQSGYGTRNWPRRGA